MQRMTLNQTPEEDCKPWETGQLQDNTNMLNNFKENLISYEKGYKKYSIKTRSELPQIRTQHVDEEYRVERQGHGKLRGTQKGRTKTIEQGRTNAIEQRRKPRLEKNKTDCNNNKSMELQPTKSENRFVKSRDFHKRGLTSIDVMEKEKENKESIVTERRDCKNPKVNFKSKIFLIAFDQQNKYRPVRKRELHQRIFGVEKQRQKYQKINELR